MTPRPMTPEERQAFETMLGEANKGRTDGVIEAVFAVDGPGVVKKLLAAEAYWRERAERLAAAINAELEVYRCYAKGCTLLADWMAECYDGDNDYVVRLCEPHKNMRGPTYITSRYPDDGLREYHWESVTDGHGLRDALAEPAAPREPQS